MCIKYNVSYVIFLLGLLACSEGKDPRIASGEYVRDGEFPFLVAIRSQLINVGDSSHVCGGAILTSDLVITATHCVGRYLEATTGILRREPNSVHDVFKIIIHKDYKEFDSLSIKNDITLLQVRPSFEFNETFYPIKLPTKDFKVTPDDKLITAGWGISSLITPDPSTELKKVIVTAVSEDYCKEKYKNDTTIFPTQLCTHEKVEEGKGPCVGDSGGPLFTQNNILVGIVSWSKKDPDCAGSKYPNVYTRVTEYVDWINEHISEIKKKKEESINIFGQPPNNKKLVFQTKKKA